MPSPHHICTVKNCHPDRSGPIFSDAPICGASGRVVEGPRHNRRVLPLLPTFPFLNFEFRFSSFASLSLQTFHRIPF